MKIGSIAITERGTVPRKMLGAYNRAGKATWRLVAEEYHTNYRPKRFTVAHGKAAGYQPRAGEQFRYGSKEFWRSYHGRKIRQKKTSAPLVWSGRTRDRARTVRITSTRNQARAGYAVNALNFRRFPAEEFRRILPEEASKLAQFYDRTFARIMVENRETATKTI